MGEIDFFGISVVDKTNQIKNWRDLFTAKLNTLTNNLHSAIGHIPDLLPFRIPSDLLAKLTVDDFQCQLKESLNKGLDTIFHKKEKYRIEDDVKNMGDSLLSLFKHPPVISPPPADAGINKIAKAGFVYYTHYFSGRFKDRNGTSQVISSETLKKLEEQEKNILSGKSKIALSGTSLEVCSQMAVILIECLGDFLFHVPFYSHNIVTATTKGKNLEKKISDFENDTALNNLINTLPFGGSEPTKDLFALLTNKNHRLNLLKIAKSEEGYLADNESVKALAKITQPGSDEQKSFSCYVANLIPKPLEKIHLNGNPSNKDYTELVGEVISTLAAGNMSQTRAIVGSAIRGGVIPGLNNEAVAELIAALAGAIVKKVTEALVCDSLKGFIIDTKNSSDSYDIPWDDKTLDKAGLLELLEEYYVKKS